MTPPRTRIETIQDLERLNSSTNGNPRYRVLFANGDSAVTQSDAAINYELSNPEFRNTRVEFKLTRAGRIYDAKPMSV